MTTQFVHSTNVSGEKSQNASPYASIFRRTLAVALVLGSILTVLNQSDALFGDGAIQYSQMALVYLIPFVVVSVSQYLGIRRAVADAAGTGISTPDGEHPFATAFHHGIPARAAIVSLIMGSLAVGFVLLSGSGGSNGIGNLPVALTAQGYILSALFGMLSQTIAYRRASHTLRRA